MEHEQYTTIGKLRIHSITAGAGKAVVFLHGWSLHAASAKRLRDILEHSCAITTPTLIGFGKSSRLPPGFDIQAYGKLFGEWLRRQGKKRITLVGHSLGGAVALLAAVHEPNAIDRVILADTIGIPFQRDARTWAAAWSKQRTYNVNLSLRRTIEVLAQPFTENLLRRGNDLYKLARLCMALDVRPFLPGVRCPVDIVWGDQDDFIPRSVGEQLHALIPQSTFHTVSGSHDWPLLEPEKLLPFVE